MGSSSKRSKIRQKAQESLEIEASHSNPVKRPKPDSDPEEEEDHGILFPPRKQETVVMPSSPGRVLEVPDCDVTIMVITLNGAIAAVSQDTALIQRAYHQLCTDNISRDKALADLTAMIREYGSSPAATRPYGSPTPTGGPRPAMQADVLDEDGNLRAADIGIITVNQLFVRWNTGYIPELFTHNAFHFDYHNSQRYIRTFPAKYPMLTSLCYLVNVRSRWAAIFDA